LLLHNLHFFFYFLYDYLDKLGDRLMLFPRGFTMLSKKNNFLLAAIFSSSATGNRPRASITKHKMDLSAIFVRLHCFNFVGLHATRFVRLRSISCVRSTKFIWRDCPVDQWEGTEFKGLTWIFSGLSYYRELVARLVLVSLGVATLWLQWLLNINSFLLSALNPFIFSSLWLLTMLSMTPSTLSRCSLVALYVGVSLTRCFLNPHSSILRSTAPVLHQVCILSPCTYLEEFKLSRADTPCVPTGIRIRMMTLA